MNVYELITELKKCKPEKTVLCQVTDQSGKAWNMHFEINDIVDSWIIQLRVFHPELEELPEMKKASHIAAVEAAIKHIDEKTDNGYYPYHRSAKSMCLLFLSMLKGEREDCI